VDRAEHDSHRQHGSERGPVTRGGECIQVTFKNQYAMNVAGNLFTPKALNRNAKAPALVVGHPMGAVKEQSANLYATMMAERGFVAMSIDLPFWGESEGQLRNLVSPDLYAEAFSAAVDYLGTRAFVDRERIGAIGICGSGSFVISAAKIDPRMKAIATVSMYDMGAANRNALRHSLTVEQRKAIIAEAAEQRYAEFTGGETKYTSGTVHELTADTHPIQREFFDFYRTPRGAFTPKGSSPKLTTHPTLTSNVKFMNFYPFNDIETISPRPMLFITGDQAHSKEFSEDAFKRAAEPKELVYVPGAGHVDLYQPAPRGLSKGDPHATRTDNSSNGRSVRARPRGGSNGAAADRDFVGLGKGQRRTRRQRGDAGACQTIARNNPDAGSSSPGEDWQPSFAVAGGSARHPLQKGHARPLERRSLRDLLQGWPRATAGDYHSRRGDGRCVDLRQDRASDGAGRVGAEVALERRAGDPISLAI
jgi:fermentation-respiration switch protein FrsA (DUF1100 family)